MIIYVLAFSNDDTGRDDYRKLISDQEDYVCKTINNKIVVIFVSPDIRLSLTDLIRNCKNQFQYNEAVNVYILAPDYRLNNIFNINQNNIIRVKTHGQFVSNFVNPALGGIIQNIQNATTNRNPIVFDPLIVIFTEEVTNTIGEVYGRPEWHKAINSNKATFYDDNLKPIPINNADKEKIRIAEFKVDNNYTVLFVKENNHGADKGGINNLLSQILNQEQWKIFPKEDIYVAVHALSDYAKDGDVDGFKKEFKDQVNYICNFHHTDDEPLYKQFCGEEGALIKFFEELNKSDESNKAEELCNDLIKLIIKISGKDIRDISLLKHQIINYLEPLRVDIDGLIDKNFENKYWDEVSKYWTGEKVEEIFKNINRVIDDFLAKKNSKKEIKDFVENIKHRINEVEDLFRVSELLNALKNNDKKTAKSICNLHSNIYKKWMDELINKFDNVKSNL